MTGCDYTYRDKKYSETEFKKLLLNGEFDKELPKGVTEALRPQFQKSADVSNEEWNKWQKENTNQSGIATHELKDGTDVDIDFTNSKITIGKKLHELDYVYKKEDYSPKTLDDSRVAYNDFVSRAKELIYGDKAFAISNDRRSLVEQSLSTPKQQSGKDVVVDEGVGNEYLPKKTGNYVEDKDNNIATAKKLLNDLGVDANFTGFSDTNGVSVYFEDANGNKYRISDHDITNKDRLKNEISLRFDNKRYGGGIYSEFEKNKKAVEQSLSTPKQQSGKDVVKPQFSKDNSEEIKRIEDDKFSTHSKIEDLEEEIKNEKSNLKEEIDRIKGEIAKVRESGLSKSVKEDRIEDLKYEIEDAKDSYDSLVQSYKEDIADEKRDLKRYEKQLSKLRGDAQFQKDNEDLSDYKELIKSLDENDGINDLEKVKKAISKMLDDNSKEHMDLVERAYDEYRQDKNATKAAPLKVEDITGLRKTILNKELHPDVRIGIDNAIRSHESVWNSVVSEANNGTFVPDVFRTQMMDRLNKKEKIAITDTMAMQLLYDRAMQQNMMYTLKDMLIDAKRRGDVSEQGMIAYQMATVDAKIEQNSEIIRKTGKEGGRGISALQAAANLFDMNLVHWTEELSKLYGGKDGEMPASAKKFVEELEKKYKTKIDELNTQIEKIKQDAADQKFKNQKQTSNTGRVAKKEQIKSLRDLADKLDGNISKNNTQMQFSADSDSQMSRALRIVADGLDKGVGLSEMVNRAVKRVAESGDDINEIKENLKSNLESAGFSRTEIDKETNKEKLKNAVIKASGIDNSTTLTQGGVSPLRRLIKEYTTDEDFGSLHSVIDAVHNDLKNDLPDITRTVIRDAYSGYGLRPETKQVIESKYQKLKEQAKDVYQYQDTLKKLNKLLDDGTNIPEQERLYKKANELKSSYDDYMRQQGEPSEDINAPQQRPDNTTQKRPSVVLSESQKRMNKVNAAIKSLESRIKKAKERLDNNEFSEEDKSTPQRSVYDHPTTQALQHELNQLNNQFQSRKQAFMDYNKPFLNKLLKGLSNLKRSFVLSHLTTFLKLSAAVVENAVAMPLREAVGASFYGVMKGIDYAMQKGFGWENPIYRDVIMKADREGVPSFVAESAAWKSINIGGKAWKDFISQAKNGYSELDLMRDGGKWHQDVPKEYQDFWFKVNNILSMPGRAHAAMKAVPERMEFERSYVLRMESAKRKGLDVNDPLIRTEIASAAVDDALSAILMENNHFTDGWRKLMQKGWDSEHTAVQALTLVGSELLPIIKVPTNMVLEAGRYTVGGHLAAIRLGYGIVAEALNNGLRKVGANEAADFVGKAGFKKLTAEQADAILLNLKKGGLSLALSMLAAAIPNAVQVSPFYHKGIKNPDGLEENEMSILGVVIPKILQDHPLFLSMKTKASAAALYDYYRKHYKKESTSVSAYYATIGTMQGLAKETPFMQQASSIINLLERPDNKQSGSFINNFIKSTIEPGLMMDIAKMHDSEHWWNPFFSDENKRKTETLGDYIKSGVPVVREQLDLKKSK